MKKFWIAWVLLAALLGFYLPMLIQLGLLIIAALILGCYYRKKYNKHLGFITETVIYSGLLAVAFLVGDLIFYGPMIWEFARQVIVKELSINMQSFLRSWPY